MRPQRGAIIARTVHDFQGPEVTAKVVVVAGRSGRSNSFPGQQAANALLFIIALGLGYLMTRSGMTQNGSPNAWYWVLALVFCENIDMRGRIKMEKMITNPIDKIKTLPYEFVIKLIFDLKAMIKPPYYSNWVPRIQG